MTPSRRSLACLSAACSALATALFITPCHAQGAQRIVCAGGAVTEVVYALGQQNRLVAVDTTSLAPPEALRDKPNVGYLRALSAEGVLSLKPDFLLAVEGAGPPDTLRLLREANLRIEVLPDDFTPEGVLNRIRAVGHALDVPPAAEALARKVDEGFATLTRERHGVSRSPRVLFVLSLANGRVMAGGRGTAADAMIRLAGGTNAVQTIEGYKPLGDEGILAAAPDVIIAMTRPGVDITAETIFAHPALALTPAAKTRALATFDGQFLLGFGPRTPEAGLALLAALRPYGGVKP